MVEKVAERSQEPEPRELVYENILSYINTRMGRASQGKVVVKGNSLPWEQNRQGLIRFYLHPLVWDEVAVPDWVVHRQKIRLHSGKHTHQGGVAIFVLEGRGYTVVDGIKYDWEEGDLIILPIKSGGCEHQHFNAEPGKPAEWLAFSHYSQYMAKGNTVRQVEDSPDWKGTPTSKPHVS